MTTTVNSLPDVTLAILAGGEGSRMGRPKGLLQIEGKPILDYLREQLDWPGPTLLITTPGREHPPGWEAFDREAIDPAPGLGPLRGVLTALERAQTSLLCVTTVDMPAIRKEHLRWLIDQLRQSSKSGLMCQRQIEAKFVTEPFPLVLRSECLPIVRARIERAQLSVVKLATEQDFAVVSAPTEWNDQTWTNLNRPEDLDAFCRGSVFKL